MYKYLKNRIFIHFINLRIQKRKDIYTMDKKLKVGVIGATGMVGQRFLTLLDNHP